METAGLAEYKGPKYKEMAYPEVQKSTNKHL